MNNIDAFLRIAQGAEMSNNIFQQKDAACSKDILDTAFLLKDMFFDDMKRDTKYDIYVKTKCWEFSFPLKTGAL